MEVMIVDSWNGYFDYFEDNQKDIYYYEEYVKLYESQDSQAKCIVCKENDNTLIMPFIRKETDSYYDFETAYGYGGPIVNTECREWIYNALVAAETFFAENRYVCGFIRFHSLLDNAEYCTSKIHTIFDRETVAIKTDETEDEIWTNQIISKNRNMIRKAEKNGLIYTSAISRKSLQIAKFSPVRVQPRPSPNGQYGVVLPVAKVIAVHRGYMVPLPKHL